MSPVVNFIVDMVDDPIVDTKCIVVLRGIPGAGKTTAAEFVQQATGLIPISADEFFADSDGFHKYDRGFISEAHLLCELIAQKNLFHGNSVVLHNVYAESWQMDSILKLARKFKAKLLIVDLKTNYGSVHDVPKSKVAEMKRSFVPCFKLPIPVWFERESQIEEPTFDALLLNPKY